MTNPLDRLTSRVPEAWRGVLDWTLSIVLAVVVVLAVKVEVANVDKRSAVRVMRLP